MRAAVYARFSSENQREQSIEDQIRVCKEFAKRDGITVLENHIYFDEAQSGSIRSRTGLEALKRAAEDKQFDAVLVDDSSRLSRDNQHFNTLLCLFQYWGISLISVGDGLDMREEHAKVAYQFRGIINELYLTDLKKQTHSGPMGQVLPGFSVGNRGTRRCVGSNRGAGEDPQCRRRQYDVRCRPRLHAATQGLDRRPREGPQRPACDANRAVSVGLETAYRFRDVKTRKAGGGPAFLQSQL